MVWPNVSMRKFPTVYHANSENLWNWLYRRNTKKKLLNFFCCVWSCGWFFWPGRDTGYHFQNYILNSLIDCFYFCNFSYQVETILYLVMKSKQEHGQIYPHLTCLPLPVCSDKEPAPELCLSDLFLSLACVSLWRTHRQLWLHVHHLQPSWFVKVWVFLRNRQHSLHSLLSADVITVPVARFSLCPSCVLETFWTKEPVALVDGTRGQSVYFCACVLLIVSFSTRTCRQELCGFSYLYCL